MSPLQSSPVHLSPVISYTPTGRVDLNTFGQTNEFAHTLLMEYTHSVVTALLVTGQNSTTLQLPGSTASYGKCTQTRTFENHNNLLPYLSN